MQQLIYSLAIVFATLGVDLAQLTSPGAEFEQGSVKANTYTNAATGITWAFPHDWTVQDNKVSVLGGDHHVILRLLPSGTESQELVEFNYSMNNSTGNPNPDLATKGWEPSGHSGYYTLGGGIPAHRSDYKSKSEPTHYLTLLDGQHHGNVSIVLIATSASRMDEFVKAVLQMQIQPDWGTPEAPPTAVTPGSPPRRVRVSQGVSQALLEHKVQPTYPERARKQHIEGSVVMLAHISTEGSIMNLFVLTGDPMLAPAAIDAVSQWRYKPYLLQGNAIEVETQIVVNFSLH